MTEQPTPRDDTPRPDASNQDFYIESNTPARAAKPNDEPVMMLPGGMLNAVLIAITFLAVGVLIGQNLSPRGLTSQEAERVVRNVLIEASLLTETQSNTELVDDDPYIGSADAPIVIVEFGDFQCRFCNIHFHQTLEPLHEFPRCEYGAPASPLRSTRRSMPPRHARQVRARDRRSQRPDSNSTRACLPRPSSR